MYRITLIILILFTIKSSAQNYGYKPQKISLQARKYVHLLAKEKSFTDEAIGYGGYKSDTYKCFEKLKNKATTKEFIELCKHPSPVVRYYAFYELKNRKVDESLLIPIIKSHLNDKATIFTQSGCLLDEELIGEYMFRRITNRYLNDKKLKREIDSLFLYSKHPLIGPGVKYLQNLPKNPKHYSRLKEMVKVEKNPEALLPLLDYNNPEDWTYIKYILEKSDEIALQAIRRYPKPAFIPFLEKVQSKSFAYPKQNWETFELEYFNIPNMILAYSIILPFDDNTKEQFFNQIFNDPTKSNPFRTAYAHLIYSKVKDMKATWTKSVKLNCLKYMYRFNQDFVNELLQYDPKSTYNILSQLPYQKGIYYEHQTISLIRNHLRATSGLDSLTYIKNELEKDLNLSFFDQYLTDYVPIGDSIYFSYYYSYLKKNMSRSDFEFSEGLGHRLREIHNIENKEKIWWLCKDYLLTDPNANIRYLLRYMRGFKNTNTLLFKLFEENTLRYRSTFAIFMVLTDYQPKSVIERVKYIYSNQSYTYKQSKIGRFIKRRHPDFDK